MAIERIVSGMRPTGHLHLGHYNGVLKNWVNLQHEAESLFFVADWHALTTHYDDPAIIEKNVSIEDVNNAVKKASENELKGILEYSSVPLVSTDILQNPHSSIYDASSTQLLDGNHIKVVCWYDNEWGYSNRIVDLVNMLVSKK